MFTVVSLLTNILKYQAIIHEPRNIKYMRSLRHNQLTVSFSTFDWKFPSLRPKKYLR
jgi:hypothetical protein